LALQQQNFTGITPAVYAAFAEKVLLDTGVQIEGDGTTDSEATLDKPVVHGGFSFIYKYSAAAGTLQIQCLTKPLLVTSHSVINGIAEEVAEIKMNVSLAQSQAAENVVKATPASPAVPSQGQPVTQ
jgi:hypothetical protein